MSPEKNWDLIDLEKVTLEDNEKLARDETGALREIVFHRHFSSLVSKAIEMDPETGEIELKEGTEDIHLIKITNRGLPRANSEGGHLAGDSVIEGTYKVLNECLADHFDESSDLGPYHNRGADFSAVINAGQEELEDIIEKIKISPVDFENSSEPTDISVVAISLKDIVEEHNERISSSESQEDAQYYQTKKALMSHIMVETELRSEQQKIADGISDIKRKIEEDASTGSASAEKYYTSYWQYYFSELKEPLTLSDFENMSDKEIDEISEQIARICVLNETPPSIMVREDSKTLEEFAETVEYEEVLANKTNFEKKHGLDFGQFSEKYKTQDREVIDLVLDIYETLREKIENKSFSIEDLEKLNNMISALNLNDQLERTVGKAMSIFSKNEFYSQINKHFADYVESSGEEKEKLKNLTQEELETLNKILHISGVSVENYLLQTDRLTGLPNKYEFSKALESMYKGDKLPEKLSVVSLDLGYLKYFNRLNGRVAGDIAIQTAAHVLEEAQKEMEKLGIKCSVYRTGGDEFSIIMEEESEKAKEIISMILKKSANVGTIPTNPEGPRNGEDYIPEMVRFGIGLCDMSLTRKLIDEELRAENSKYPEDSNDRKILLKALAREELDTEAKKIFRMMQVRVADEIQDKNKTRSRIYYIAQKYSQVLEKEDPREMEKFAKFMQYSGKALKGRGIPDIARMIKYANESEIDWQNPDIVTDEQEEKLFEMFFSEIETVTEIV